MTLFTPPSRIGFYGFGNMAQAIWAGAQTYCNAHQITAHFTRRQTALGDSLSQEHNISFVSQETCLSSSDLLILAIKPQQLSDVKNTLNQVDWSRVCLISLLAGTPIKRLQDTFPGLTHVIRVMPNTAASLGESMSIMTPSNSTHPKWVDFTQQMFNTIGKTLTIPEHLMDFCTGLCGSGPAYLYSIANALIQLAHEQGLSQEDASLLVNQLFLGSSKKLNAGTDSPSDMIQSISSPNGTTVAGLKQYEDLAISDAIQSVIMAAAKRSSELSQ